VLPPSSPYVLRERVWSLWRVAWIVLLLVLFGGIAASFAADNEVQPLGLGIVVAFLLALFVLMLPRRQVLLRVGHEGISLKRSTGRLATGARSRHIPWSSVAQVVVADLGDGRPVRVGLRLRPGAPLPWGVRAVIGDPSDRRSLQPELAQDVPAAALDRARLAAAVRAFAPPGVELLPEPGMARAQGGW
jgi:hypothetical protein